jgi:hypothetical protein
MEAIPLKFWLTFMGLYRVLYKKIELYGHHCKNLTSYKIHAFYVTLSITYKPRTAEISPKQAADLSSSSLRSTEAMGLAGMTFYS